MSTTHAICYRHRVDQIVLQRDGRTKADSPKDKHQLTSSECVSRLHANDWWCVEDFRKKPEPEYPRAVGCEHRNRKHSVIFVVLELLLLYCGRVFRRVSLPTKEGNAPVGPSWPLVAFCVEITKARKSQSEPASQPAAKTVGIRFFFPLLAIRQAVSSAARYVQAIPFPALCFEANSQSEQTGSQTTTHCRYHRLARKGESETNDDASCAHSNRSSRREGS